MLHSCWDATSQKPRDLYIGHYLPQPINQMKQADFALSSVLDPQAYITSLVNGYMVSSALFAATASGVFEALRNGAKTPGELAEMLSIRVPEGLRRLLYALVGMKLVTIDPEGAVALAPAMRRFLLRDSESSMTAAIQHHHRHSYRHFEALAQRVADGPVAEDADLYDTLAGSDAEYELFLKAMNGFSVGVGEKMAQMLDLRDARLIFDIGGGGGQVSLELLCALPLARVKLFDRSESLNFARTTIGQRHADRFSCIAVDILALWPEPAEKADLVILSAVLGDWDRDTIRTILHNAWMSLRPGGRLIVSETLLDDDRVGPFAARLLSLYVFLLTQGGDNYTEKEWRAILADAGIGDVQVIRSSESGVRDMLICSKPADGAGSAIR